MAIDLSHLIAQSQLQHSQIVHEYLTRHGLVELPQLEYANADETQIRGWQPGATIDHTGEVSYIYNEIPVEATVQDFTVALQNNVLFQSPPEEADSSSTESRASSAKPRRRRSSSSSKPAADADADADADTNPNG